MKRGSTHTASCGVCYRQLPPKRATLAVSLYVTASSEYCCTAGWRSMKHLQRCPSCQLQFALCYLRDELLKGSPGRPQSPDHLNTTHTHHLLLARPSHAPGTEEEHGGGGCAAGGRSASFPRQPLLHRRCCSAAAAAAGTIGVKQLLVSSCKPRSDS